jgi:hypothetical protein
MKRQWGRIIGMNNEQTVRAGRKFGRREEDPIAARQRYAGELKGNRSTAIDRICR